MGTDVCVGLQWEWECRWCHATGSMRTKAKACEAWKAHELTHLSPLLEDMVAEGLLEHDGDRRGKPVYRATEFGKQVLATRGQTAKLGTRH